MADKLEELKKKIYSKEGPKERKQKEFYETQRKKADSDKTYWDDKENGTQEGKIERHEIGSFRPYAAGERQGGGVAGEGPVLTTADMSMAKRPFYKSKIFILTWVFSLAAIIAASGFIYYGVFPKEGVVVLEITGDVQIEAGDTKIWTVIVRNNLGVVVKNSELNFIYPNGAIPVGDESVTKNLRSKIRIDEIGIGEEKKFIFSAQLFGNIGEEKTAEVLILYQPENISSRLQKQTSFTMTIFQVPLTVFYNMPEKIVNGQDVKIMIDVTSGSKAVFGNLYLRMDWPLGFEFLSSDIKPDYANNIWKLGDLKEGESRRLAVSARVVGFPEEIKSLVAGLGEYNPQTRQFKTYFEKAGEIHIASPPLFVRQSVNGVQNYSARFGESLSFSVYYKNNLSLAVKDVFIRARMSEEFLDMRSLKVEKGFFDGGARELVWNASSNPELKEMEPGEDGVVTFSVVIKRQPTIGSFSDKNFFISSLAKISTQTIPAGFEGIKLGYEDSLDVKLESQLSVSAKAVFYNSLLGPNIGVLPPRVGKETGYTVIFQISNLSNDLENVKLHASLPGNVKWLDQITGDRKERLNFNSSSGELVWDVGNVSAGTGVVRPRTFLAFNVAITPGEDVLNIRALLVKNIRISGTDSFTKTVLESMASDVTTELKEDLQTTNKDWSVAE